MGLIDDFFQPNFEVCDGSNLYITLQNLSPPPGLNEHFMRLIFVHSNWSGGSEVYGFRRA